MVPVAASEKSGDSIFAPHFTHTLAESGLSVWHAEQCMSEQSREAPRLASLLAR